MERWDHIQSRRGFELITDSFGLYFKNFGLFFRVYLMAMVPVITFTVLARCSC